MAKTPSKPKPGADHAPPLVVTFASTEVNEAEAFCTISTSGDHGLTEVRLYEETVAHVEKSHAAQFPPQFQADLPSIVHAVGETVREPVSTEPSYNNSVRFIGATVNARNHPMNVFVQKLSGTTTGYVTTYFFTGMVKDEDDEP